MKRKWRIFLLAFSLNGLKTKRWKENKISEEMKWLKSVDSVYGQLQGVSGVLRVFQQASKMDWSLSPPLYLSFKLAYRLSMTPFNSSSGAAKVIAQKTKVDHYNVDCLLLQRMHCSIFSIYCDPSGLRYFLIKIRRILDAWKILGFLWSYIVSCPWIF